MGRYLTIIEVSQKQAYIFSSNKLKENIDRSKEIAMITSSKYIEETINAVEIKGFEFSVKANLVYSGGGHTILEFPSEDIARLAAKTITSRVMNEIPEIELFVKTKEYDEKLTPGENIKDLTKGLEKKKSKRLSFFHQGTFGIEEFDQNTGKPIRIKEKKSQIPTEESVPEGFHLTSKFEQLGGSRDKTNFIAVVHIDGNAMGKRVEELSSRYEIGQWEEYKQEMRLFSESIANDFLQAYREMEETVAGVIRRGGLEELNLKQEKGTLPLPVRRVIAEGDDICFVSEGRIGVECAVAFIRSLVGRINKADGKSYAACAGVALVHQKYPFYRAYELAEELCSHAKKFGASLSGDGTGAKISSIDWHVEFGELQDSLEDIRDQYIVTQEKAGSDGRNRNDLEDNNEKTLCLELRPYIVEAPQDILDKEPIRQYDHFHDLMRLIINGQDAYSTGTMKELRQALKMGKEATRRYLTFHKISELGRDIYQGNFVKIDFEGTHIGSGKLLARRLYATTADGVERSLIFDAIEMMDTFLSLG